MKLYWQDKKFFRYWGLYLKVRNHRVQLFGRFW